MTVLANGSLDKEKRMTFDIKTAGPAIALILLCIIGFVLNPAFLSEGNISNLLTRSAFIGIIAVGATFVITAGGIDLSVGSMAAAIAGVMIIIMNNAVETFGGGLATVLLGCGCSILLGIGAGWINGVLTTKGKIEAFIVTLGTMGIYRSLVTYFAVAAACRWIWPFAASTGPCITAAFLACRSRFGCSSLWPSSAGSC